MGFGFNLLMVFILFPLKGLLLTGWLLKRKIIFGKLIGLIWLGILSIVLLAITIN
jgi:hypothetical protein